ncbi:envelope glycoprotein K [Beluga whale alphaherpesvirus 1]|uniref:Envelope glycoprotein K n=1 Tax=Beluga whale alphaherpesvirus 1 TaxID=1434720 RepID=A0A286RUF5_9ALPH|nr:envelope glycoprotein K [Beluga whale alphaherpesvirus 1]ASW27052.1 envelope glycoprotein K [Beluga whale alphaherpesvirus 1]
MGLPTGGRPAHVATLGLMTANVGFLVAVAIYAPLAHTCVYATRDHGPTPGPLTWGPYDTSVLYFANLSSMAATMTAFDGPCDVAAINASYASVIHGPLVARAKTVFGARNCRARLWREQLKWMAVAWLLYATFVYLRQERSMFGVFRDERALTPATLYTLNYAAGVMAATVLRLPYTKFARLLCEFEAVRRAACYEFRVDPVTFLWHHATAGLLLAAEFAARLGARVIATLTIVIVDPPCAQAFPLYVRIVEWVFLGVVLCVEVTDALYSATPRPARDGDARAQAGSTQLCINCCSTLVAGVVMKLVYVGAIVGGIALLLHYEHRAQVRLFGA